MDYKTLKKAKELDKELISLGEKMQEIYNGFFKITVTIDGLERTVKAHNKEIQDAIYKDVSIKYRKLLKEFQEL